MNFIKDISKTSLKEYMYRYFKLGAMVKHWKNFLILTLNYASKLLKFIENISDVL